MNQDKKILGDFHPEKNNKDWNGFNNTGLVITEEQSKNNSGMSPLDFIHWENIYGGLL